jgi:hypothetical protein
VLVQGSFLNPGDYARSELLSTEGLLQVVGNDVPVNITLEIIDERDGWLSLGVSTDAVVAALHGSEMTNSLHHKTTQICIALTFLLTLPSPLLPLPHLSFTRSSPSSPSAYLNPHAARPRRVMQSTTCFMWFLSGTLHRLHPAPSPVSCTVSCPRRSCLQSVKNDVVAAYAHGSHGHVHRQADDAHEQNQVFLNQRLT